MSDLAPFALPKWIGSNKDNVKLALAGSATPALSIQDLIDLSSDKATTTANLSIKSLPLSLGPFEGSEPLRAQIASLYNANANASANAPITADNIFPTHGTTGANALVFQNLLKAGDHVIAMCPVYMQLISLPKSVPGVEVSYWKLDLENQAHANMTQLKAMIKPNTKMIILNNPNNPLGTILPLETQHAIVDLARDHGVYLLADEIFRPLFHDNAHISPSFLDLSTYDGIIVTSSMSKAWGLSGTRLGWLATRNTALLSASFNRGLYTIMSLSTIDSVITTEALSARCTPQILAKHRDIARRNVALLDAFVARFKDVCSWVRPCAGGTGFLRFGERQGGVPVDDVEFCRRLLSEKGVLLAPGSLCFGNGEGEEFRGYVRVHTTSDPEVMERALGVMGEFLGEYLS